MYGSLTGPDGSHTDFGRHHAGETSRDRRGGRRVRRCRDRRSVRGGDERRPVRAVVVVGAAIVIVGATVVIVGTTAVDIGASSEPSTSEVPTSSAADSTVPASTEVPATSVPVTGEDGTDGVVSVTGDVAYTNTFFTAGVVGAARHPRGPGRLRRPRPRVRDARGVAGPRPDHLRLLHVAVHLQRRRCRPSRRRVSTTSTTTVTTDAGVRSTPSPTGPTPGAIPTSRSATSGAAAGRRRMPPPRSSTDPDPRRAR